MSLVSVTCNEPGVPAISPDENVSLTENSVDLFVGDECRGRGKLMVTNRRVLWCAEGAESSTSVSFRKIVIHAISKDLEAFDRPCIYCQLEAEEDVTRDVSEASDNDEDSEEEDVDEEPEAPEIRFIPEQPTDEALQRIFTCMSAMAELNPDSDGEDDDEDDDAVVAGEGFGMFNSDGWCVAGDDDEGAMEDAEEDEDDEDDEDEAEAADAAAGSGEVLLLQREGDVLCDKTAEASSAAAVVPN
eukprot:GDKH01010324.1.p1 GENE.GDKH01010324.1~~GDKH01010324.1.p1  ORF type:complete len:244 (-),score=68.52 GDKH01010324.1:82-813(-)